MQLLEASGLPFEVLPLGRPGGSLLSGAVELIRRSWALRQRIRRHGVKVVLTRNPSGAIAAFGTRATSIFDTDDGRSVGIHYWTSRPFANIITSSSFDSETHGRALRQYRALKAQMFTRDRPQANVGIGAACSSREVPLFVARFSAHTATHDSRVWGLNKGTRLQLLSILKACGNLVVSIEGHEPTLQSRSGDSQNCSRLNPDSFLELIADADLVVSDSGSVCAEAALLGTPSIVFGSFVSNRFYIRELETRGLLRAFSPGQEESLLLEVRHATENLSSLRLRHRKNLDAFERETDSLVEWYLDLINCILRQSRVASER